METCREKNGYYKRQACFINVERAVSSQEYIQRYRKIIMRVVKGYLRLNKYLCQLGTNSTIGSEE